MSDLKSLWKSRLKEWQCHIEEPSNGNYWCPEWDTATPSKLTALHDEKLPLVVGYMYEYSPFYRQLYQSHDIHPDDIHSMADLRRLPIVTKNDMSRDVDVSPPWGNFTAVTDEEWNRNGWLMFATSGTTARPRPFRYTKFDQEMWTWTDARALWSMGIRPGDRALLAFGYGPHVAMWGMHYALNRMGVPILPAGSWDTAARAEAILTYHPTVIAATPSYALNLAEVLRTKGVQPSQTSVRIIISLGEPLPPATKNLIHDEWDAEVHQFWGCTEAAPSCGGYTCGNTIHIMEDTHFIEVVDPDTLEPLEDGQSGLVVLTNLCSEASPQVRFLVGDFATLSREPCPCGRTHVHTDGFMGRADDMLNIRGVTVFPSAVEDIVRSFPELGYEFQIILEKDGHRDVFRLQIEVLPDYEGSSKGIAEKVASSIRTHFDLGVKTEVLPWGTLPKTEFKAHRVKDLRK